MGAVDGGCVGSGRGCLLVWDLVVLVEGDVCMKPGSSFFLSMLYAPTWPSPGDVLLFRERLEGGGV